MLNRPPPYFPQGQLSPPDESRYKKFKMIMALVVIGLVILLGAVGFGIYYAIAHLF